MRMVRARVVGPDGSVLGGAGVIALQLLLAFWAGGVVLCVLGMAISIVTVPEWTSVLPAERMVLTIVTWPVSLTFTLLQAIARRRR